ncbi:MAG TPA: hypothetical protein VF682_13220 [Pseudomonas sp.]
MGRQITVGLLPLLKAGCRLQVVNHGGLDAYLQVETPNGQIICSDDSSLGLLGFDCRDKETSSTGWMEDWLILNDIPYVQG